MPPRRRVKYTPPVRQWSGPNGWCLAKGKVRHAYEVLYQGQLVGYVYPEDGSWWWMTQSYPRNKISTEGYGSWRDAAAGITHTTWAHKIAGHRRHHVKPEQWERHPLLRGEPWVPKPAPPKEDEERQP